MVKHYMAAILEVMVAILNFFMASIFFHKTGATKHIDTNLHPSITN